MRIHSGGNRFAQMFHGLQDGSARNGMRGSTKGSTIPRGRRRRKKKDEGDLLEQDSLLNGSPVTPLNESA